MVEGNESEECGTVRKEEEKGGHYQAQFQQRLLEVQKEAQLGRHIGQKLHMKLKLRIQR